VPVTTANNTFDEGAKKRIHAQQELQLIEEHEVHAPQDNITLIIGYCCLLGGATLFILTVYSMFFAKRLDDSEYILIKFMRQDEFYCYLVPLIIPIASIYVYLNWISMKFFRHT
jgi:hypothetical protein